MDTVMRNFSQKTIHEGMAHYFQWAIPFIPRYLLFQFPIKKNIPQIATFFS